MSFDPAKLGTTQRWKDRKLKEIRERKKPNADKEYDARQRICLTCSKPFQSEGIHNRMCKKCKGHA